MKELRALGSATIVALFALLISMIMAVGAPASDAQQVECDDVPYNERIVRVCATVEEPSEGAATPTPVPEDADRDEDEADRSSAREDDGDAEVDTEASSSDEPNVVERGDRGGRNPGAGAGVDGQGPSDDAPQDSQPDVTPSGGQQDDAQDVDERGPARTGQAPVDDADQAEPNQAATGSALFDSTPNPPPDNVGLIASAAVLAGLGGVFFLGARANRRQHDASHK